MVSPKSLFASLFYCVRRDIICIIFFLSKDIICIIFFCPRILFVCSVVSILIFTKTFQFRITNFGLFVLLYPPNISHFGDIMQIIAATGVAFSNQLVKCGFGVLWWHFLQVQIIAATETYKLTSVKNSVVNAQPVCRQIRGLNSGHAVETTKLEHWASFQQFDACPKFRPSLSVLCSIHFQNLHFTVARVHK